MSAPIKHYPPLAKFFVLLALLLFNYVLFPSVALVCVTQVFGTEVAEKIVKSIVETPQDKYIYLFILGISSIGLFIFTSVLYSQLENGNVSERLRLNRKVQGRHLVIALVGIVAAQLFIETLTRLNQNLPLPSGLQFLHETGTTDKKLTNAFLDMNSVPALLVNILVLGIIPAIGEEFLFRGVLLIGFLKSRMNAVWAIALSALLFAMAHMIFDNTLAIWVLGVYLGFLYYISGSIWLPIAAHFTNNFLTVLFKYLYGAGVVSIDVAEISYPWYAVLISVVVFAGCILLLYNWKTPPEQEEEIFNEEGTS